MPYEVEYLRNGVPDVFLTRDKYRADEFAVKHHGIVYELVRNKVLPKVIEVYQCPGKLCEPSCMTNEAGCCPKG